jgi:putative tricarboxylic transport membrane protein
MSSRRTAFRWRRSRRPLVPGNRAEDAFRLSMIGSGGDMKVFWSNGLVGSITTLAIVLWPLIDKAFGSVGRLWRPAKAAD